MKRTLKVIALVFLFCITNSCQQGERVLVESKADVEADIQAIKNIVADYNAALNESDVARMMTIYADDAIEIRPNQPAFFGKEAIRSGKQNMFSEVNITEKDDIKSVEVSGNLAVAHFVWSANATFTESGNPANSKGNAIRIFERQTDGAWKCIYSIWSNEDLILKSKMNEER